MSDANINESLIWSIKNGDLEAVIKHVDAVTKTQYQDEIQDYCFSRLIFESIRTF